MSLNDNLNQLHSSLKKLCGEIESLNEVYRANGAGLIGFIRDNLENFTMNCSLNTWEYSGEFGDWSIMIDWDEITVCSMLGENRTVLKFGKDSSYYKDIKEMF